MTRDDAQSLTTLLPVLYLRGFTNISQFVLPLMRAITKEITIRFSLGYNNKDFAAVVADFVAGNYAGCEKMITARVSLDDLVEKGFKELLSNMDSHCKIVVTPRKELLAA